MEQIRQSSEEQVCNLEVLLQEQAVNAAESVEKSNAKIRHLEKRVSTNMEWHESRLY